ncbi:MAG: DUF5719 family protein [Acidimicrobiales bacterium]
MTTPDDQQANGLGESRPSDPTSPEPTVPIATTGGRRGARRRVARLPVLVAIPAILAGFAAIDRVGAGDAADADGTDASASSASRSAAHRSLMPVAAPEGSLSSTWFCAGGTATDDGVADHTVVVANPGDEPVTAIVTIYPGALDTDPNAGQIADQPEVSEPLDVGARSRATLRLGDVVDAPFAAALVEAPGGDIVVEHQVSSDRGTDTAPCASAASPTWYFAAGSTNRQAQELIVLFNPFPDDAVVDLTFATPEGFRSPQPYSGLIVPGEQVVALDATAVVARHDNLSASIDARRGRVVADRIQIYDGFRGRGIAVGLGQPQLSELLFFPDGITGEGFTERFMVFNPSDAPAQLDIEIYLDDPATNGEVEPVAVTVQPESHNAVELSGDPRIPSGVRHSAIVRVHNGVPVAAEQELFGEEPASARGVAVVAGSPLLADTWVLGAGEASEGIGELVTLFNPSLGEGISRVRIAALDGSGGDVPTLTDLEVQPGGRLTIDLGEHLNRESLALYVEATRPVVVERLLFRRGGRGMSQALGVPLARRIERPPALTD